MKSSSLKEKKSEDPLAKRLLIEPDGYAHYGGLWRASLPKVRAALLPTHWFVFLYTAQTNSHAVSLRD